MENLSECVVISRLICMRTSSKEYKPSNSSHQKWLAIKITETIKILQQTASNGVTALKGGEWEKAFPTCNTSAIKKSLEAEAGVNRIVA